MQKCILFLLNKKENSGKLRTSCAFMLMNYFSRRRKMKPCLFNAWAYCIKCLTKIRDSGLSQCGISPPPLPDGGSGEYLADILMGLES